MYKTNAQIRIKNLTNWNICETTDLFPQKNLLQLAETTHGPFTIT